MAKAAVSESPHQGTENFAALLDESLGQARSLEGAVLRGRVVAIENDTAVVDVGLKSEGPRTAQGIRRTRTASGDQDRRYRRGLSRAHGR
jgi:ribosomal protein S1